jgi:hypothetical protein
VPPPAGTADGDEPETGGGGAPLDASPEHRVKQRRIAEGAGTPGARDFKQQPSPSETRGRRQ